MAEEYKRNLAGDKTPVAAAKIHGTRTSTTFALKAVILKSLNILCLVISVILLRLVGLSVF